MFCFVIAILIRENTRSWSVQRDLVLVLSLFQVSASASFLGVPLVLQRKARSNFAEHLAKSSQVQLSVHRDFKQSHLKCDRGQPWPTPTDRRRRRPGHKASKQATFHPQVLLSVLLPSFQQFLSLLLLHGLPGTGERDRYVSISKLCVFSPVGRTVEILPTSCSSEQKATDFGTYTRDRRKGSSGKQRDEK